MNIRSHLVGGLIGMVFPVIAAAVSFNTADVASVNAAIENNGPEAVITSLWQNESDKTQALDGIQSGDSQWLQVAQSLSTVSNPDQRFELMNAVGLALTVNPAGVLAFVGNVAELQEVCTIPLVEPTTEQTLEYTMAAINALQTPLSSELEPLRNECLAQMQTIKEHSQ